MSTPRPTGTTFREWVAGGRHVSLDGHRIFVRQDGPADGAPVTLVHGFPTSSHDWSPVVPELVRAGHRVTTLDLLGFGASEKPRRHRYDLGEQASLVEAAWRHLDVRGTALVAHDMGVSVAQELLARDPARIERVAWLNGGLYPDLHRPIPIQRLLHGPAGRLLGPLASERTFRAGMRRVLGRPVDDGELHEMWLAVSHDGGAAIQHRLLRYIDDRGANGRRWVDALESHPGPSLFVWGPLDPVSGAHVLPRLRERMPRAALVVLDGVGHYPQVESPTDVLAALVPFLAGGTAEARPGR